MRTATDEYGRPGSCGRGCRRVFHDPMPFSVAASSARPFSLTVSRRTRRGGSAALSRSSSSSRARYPSSSAGACSTSSPCPMTSRRRSQRWRLLLTHELEESAHLPFGSLLRIEEVEVEIVERNGRSARRHPGIHRDWGQHDFRWRGKLSWVRGRCNLPLQPTGRPLECRGNEAASAVQRSY